MILIAGTIHQHRNAQPLNLLYHLRRVVDHGVFHRQVTAGGQDGFVIRCRIFTGVEDFPFLHGLSGLGQIPGGCLLTAELDCIQGIQLAEVIHRSTAHHIDILQRLPQHCHILGNTLRNLSPLRYYQEGLIRAHGELLIALGLGNREFLGIAKGLLLKVQVRPAEGFFDGSFRLRLHHRRPGGTAPQEKGQCRQNQNNASFHALGLTVSA